MNQHEEFKKLARDIRAISQTPRLIVIDTLQVYMRGHENDAKDMGSFVEGCLELRNETGSAVWVVHHLGKDVGKEARGHTSLIGAADFSYLAEKTGHIMKLDCKKMKEADDQFSMFLEPVKVVVDLDGEFPDSLVLNETQQPGNDETTSILRLAKEFDGQGQKKFLQAVKDVLQLPGAYKKIKKVIPEGKDNALSFEGGLLWIEPDPGNTRGEKMIRYEQDYIEEDISGLLA